MIINRDKQKIMRCDKCGKEYEMKDDGWVEVQEFLNINFVGGYGSVFGDGNKIRCDICQYCLYDMISNICHSSYI